MATSTNTSSVEILEQQKKRLRALEDRRTRAQVRLESERKSLVEAQEEAKKLFGTDNLDELRELYKRRHTENDQKIMDFVLALDDIEKSLSDIERQLAPQ